MKWDFRYVLSLTMHEFGLVKFLNVMRYALNKSTAFHVVEFRGAIRLDAQYRMED